MIKTFDAACYEFGPEGRIKIYSEILQTPSSKLIEFFNDVRDIKGKYKGIATSEPSPDQSTIMSGFTENNLKKYLGQLDYQIKNRLRVHLEPPIFRGQNNKKRVYHCSPDSNLEKEYCRAITIRSTLIDLIPNLNEIFTLEKLEEPKMLSPESIRAISNANSNFVRQVKGK